MLLLPQCTGIALQYTSPPATASFSSAGVYAATSSASPTSSVNIANNPDNPDAGFESSVPVPDKACIGPLGLRRIARIVSFPFTVGFLHLHSASSIFICLHHLRWAPQMLSASSAAAPHTTADAGLLLVRTLWRTPPLHFASHLAFRYGSHCISHRITLCIALYCAFQRILRRRYLQFIPITACLPLCACGGRILHLPPSSSYMLEEASHAVELHLPLAPNVSGAGEC
jgi:hypothetical protein